MTPSRPKPPRPSVPAPPGQGGFVRGFLAFLFLPVYLVWTAARAFAVWVWHAPRFIKLIMFVVLLAAAGGLAVAARKLFRYQTINTNYMWAEFGNAAQTSDVEGMTAALNKIISVKPDDVYARSRLRALETGEAEVDDGKMCWLLTRVHLMKNQFPEAVREARKCLQSEPKDWLSHCVLAKDALNRNDAAAAAGHLDLVANPDTSPTKPDLGMILFAIELREKAGLDCADLRAFLLSRVMPNLKNINLSQIRASGKIQIVYSYATSVASIPDVTLVTTMQYWAFSAQLADQTLAEAAEDKNAAVLNQLASLQSVLAFCITRFSKNGLVREDEAAEMTREVDARGEAAWRALRGITPTDPNAYAGTAAYLLKAEKYDEAEAEIAAGLKAAGPYPQLVRLYVVVAAKRDRSEDALKLALAVANKNPELAQAWQVVVEAAVAARRRDIAIQACQEVRKSKPDLPWANGVEGALWLETGDAHKALQILSKIPIETRATTPFIARAYAKALAASGNEILSPQFVRNVISEAESKNQPLLARSVVMGMAEAPPTASRADFVVEQLDRILAKWSSDPELQLEGSWARANALYQSAELSTPRWEPSRLERAIRAYDSLTFQFPKDPRGHMRLAQLKLYGQKKPGNAIDHAVKLRQLPDPTIEARETMGAVYVAQKKYDDAVAILEPVGRLPTVSGFCLTQLALAYHGQGDSVQAKRVLQRASVLPMNDRERDEYRLAAVAITRE
jgi:predicted Zn-dependent protease